MKREERLRLIEVGDRELAAAEQRTAKVETTTAATLATVAADVAEGIVTAAEAADIRTAAADELSGALDREDALRHGLPELRERLTVEDEQRRQQQLGSGAAAGSHSVRQPSLRPTPPPARTSSPAP